MVEVISSALKRGVFSAGFILSLGSCSLLNYGTRTESLGDGRYMVLTPSIWHVTAENTNTSQDQCPGGYKIVREGKRPDSAFNVTFLQSDYARYWVIDCGTH